jgi:hypothetical protein
MSAPSMVVRWRGEYAELTEAVKWFFAIAKNSPQAVYLQFRLVVDLWLNRAGMMQLSTMGGALRHPVGPKNNEEVGSLTILAIRICNKNLSVCTI